MLEYIHDNIYVLTLVLAALGLFLKKTPKIADWSIPYILGVIGAVLATAILKDVVEGVIQGVLVTAVAVYGHNLIKQAIERE